MKKDSGNVLFLILIAVALFAALSYAVTQSSRSGGGSISKEKLELDISALFQHVTTLRSGIMRFTMTKGVAASDLNFTETYTLPNQRSLAVFHSEGANIIVPWKYEDDPGLPLSLYEGGEFYSPWAYNWNHEIADIGSTSTGSTATTLTADVIAFAPGLSEQACKTINQKSDVGDIIPEFSNTQIFSTSGMGSPGGGGNVLGDELSDKWEGCYRDLTNDIYVFYAVLFER